MDSPYEQNETDPVAPNRELHFYTPALTTQFILSRTAEPGEALLAQSQVSSGALKLLGRDDWLSTISEPALETDGGSRVSTPAFVIANPPFGVDLEEFVSKLIDNARDGAQVNVVLPEGFLFRKKYLPLRSRLLNACDLKIVIRLPEALFQPHASVRSFVLAFGPGRTSSIQFVDHSGKEPSSIADSVRSLSSNSTDENGLADGRFLTVDDLGPDFLLAIDVAPPTVARLSPLSDPSWPLRKLAPFSDLDELEDVAVTKVLRRIRRPVHVEDGLRYTQVSLGRWGKGARFRKVRSGREIKTKRQYLLRSGDLVVSRIDARAGGIAIIPASLDGAIVSSEYFVFRVVGAQAEVVLWALLSEPSIQAMSDASLGSTGRVRISLESFMRLRLCVPSGEGTRERICALVARLHNLG